MRETIRATLVGGVVFLVPLVCVVVFVGKAFSIMKTVGQPLANLIPVEKVAGIAFIEILTGLILFAACLIAGLIARSPLGRRLYQKLDALLLNLIPAYAWIKGITADVSDAEIQSEFKPVLVRFDDQYQLAFEVDRVGEALVAVYLPGAPDARAGAISYVENDRVQPMAADFTAISKACKKLGRDSGELVTKLV